MRARQETLSTRSVAWVSGLPEYGYWVERYSTPAKSSNLACCAKRVAGCTCPGPPLAKARGQAVPRPGLALAKARGQAVPCPTVEQAKKKHLSPNMRKDAFRQLSKAGQPLPRRCQLSLSTSSTGEGPRLYPLQRVRSVLWPPRGSPPPPPRLSLAWPGEVSPPGHRCQRPCGRRSR
jgi:hypothetical protein